MAINPLVSKPSLKLCLDVISVGKSAAGDAVPENKDPFVGNIIHHHMHNSLNHIIAANTNNPEADAVDNSPTREHTNTAVVDCEVSKCHHPHELNYFLWHVSCYHLFHLRKIDYLPHLSL